MRSLSLLALFLSTAALADPCITSSNGLSFYDNSHSAGASSGVVVTRCQNNPFTNNQECRQNLDCSYYVTDPYPNGILCSTESRRIPFRETGYDINALSQGVVRLCQSNPYTSNDECRRNLVCTDASGGGGFPPAPPAPPFPPTPPQPPVPPMPPAPIERWVCNVSTRHHPRGYDGHGPTRGSAELDGRRECMRYERPFTCNRESHVSCRQY